MKIKRQNFCCSKCELLKKSEEVDLKKLARMKFHNFGFAPWVNWESERTSFGKIFRKIAFFPSFFPLFVSSDHYVDHLLNYRENEYNFIGSIYLTWNKRKSLIMQKNGINSIFITHPFIFWKNKYYKQKNISNQNQKIGTVVFWPHSSEVVRVDCIDFEKYFEELKRIPSEFHPISIFVSGQDLTLPVENLQKQIDLLKKGPFKIDSFGNISNRNYVDKFYSILTKTKLTTSPMLGSQVFYTIDLLIPYLLIGDNYFKMYHKVGNNFIEWTPLSDYPDSEELDTYYWFYSELKKMNFTIESDVLNFVRNNLGYDSKISRLKFTLIIWSAFFQNLLKITPYYNSLFKKIIHKVKTYE